MVTTYYYHGSKLVALRKGTALEYVHQDHLGGTAVTTDIAGAEESRRTYLPFGITRTSAGVDCGNVIAKVGRPAYWTSHG